MKLIKKYLKFLMPVFSVSGDSSPPANTTTKTTTELPTYIQPYAVNLMQTAGRLAQRPYQQYKGQQVAPLNAMQNQGVNLVNYRANNGSPMLAAANKQATNTLNGGYLNQGAFKNQLANLNTATANPLANANTAARNSMAGVNNPYLNQVISNTNQDIVNTFRNAQMPQTDASFARAGAFGGSAWQQANAENNRQMANEIAKNTANLRMGDYSQQQQLAENLANRQTQSNVNSQQLAESLANRQSQSLQNQQNFAQQYANQQQNAFQNERQRQIGAIGEGQNLNNQTYTDAQQLLGAGDVKRDYQQTLNSLGYQNFLNQQNWPLQNLDIMGNAISRLMGGGGSSIQQTPMPQVNRTASMLGGGLAGGMLGSQLGNQLGGLASQYGGAAGAGLGALAGLL